MSAEIKVLENINVKLDSKRVRNRICPNPDKWLQEIIDRAVGECQTEAKAVYGFFSCEAIEDGIKVMDTSFKSRMLANRFRHAKEIGLFVVTIGSSIETMVKNAFDENDYVNGLVYDAIGSEYADSLAQALHKLLEKEKGYCMSRCSPGYGDWQLSEQKKLFEFVPGDKIGVKLTGSFLMLPEKSVSAIIGFSDKKSHGCGDCDKTGCAYRQG